MHGCSAFFTLDVRVAILLALFASVLLTLALSSFSPWYLAAKYVFDSHNAETSIPLPACAWNAVDATPARRRAPLLVDNTTSSYHRPDPSSGTIEPEVIALL